MKSFDYYEFTGIIVPGAITLFGVLSLYPGLKIPSNGLTVGDLGIFTILAYATGHLAQALGDVIDALWWRTFWGGMPTDWVRTNVRNLIASGQRETLFKQIPMKLRMQNFDLTKIEAGEWYGITRQIYAAVSAQSRATRIDIFNGNYGLNRGLTAALLIFAVIFLIKDLSQWRLALLAFAGALLALARMHRFGIHYARELFVQFLQLPDSPQVELPF